MDDADSVVVVGCGIAGAAVALLLARQGLQVTLVERAPALQPVGSGLLLQPSGQCALAAIGLLDEVVAQSAPIAEVLALTHRERVLVRLVYDELGAGVRAYGVRRSVLFDALLNSARGAGVRMLTGCEVTAAEQRPDGVILLAADGSRIGPFDLAIAADGSRSQLRRHVSAPRMQHSYRWGALWGIAACELENRLHQVVRGTQVLLGLLPVGAGHANFFWSVRHDQLEELRGRGFRRFRDEALELCPLAEGPLAEFAGFEALSFTTCQHVWLPRWHSGRICALGDAAHAMSPHLGQGVNLALADALALANALERSRSYAAGFREFERSRRKQTRFYSSATLALTPFFQSGGRVKGTIRDRALPLLASNDRMRHRMTVTMAGLASGFWGDELAPR